MGLQQLVIKPNRRNCVVIVVVIVVTFVVTINIIRLIYKQMVVPGGTEKSKNCLRRVEKKKINKGSTRV